MKTLLTVLVVLGMAGVAWGHNKEQWTCITLTSVGAYAVTRVAVDRGLSITFPKMSKENKAGWIGVAGFVASYGLLRLSQRMYYGNAQHDQNSMMHLGKDNIVPIITGAGMMFDAWRLSKTEKKKK